MTQPDFVLANKKKFDRSEALELVGKADTVLVSKGKKLIRFDNPSSANEDELAGVILGRSGTLRAPAIRVGGTFLVGYHAEAYADVFKG